MLQIGGVPPAARWIMMAFGAGLILLGVLFIARPELFMQIAAFVFAAILIMVGVSIVGAAWRMGGGVTYRRLDERDDVSM